MILAAYLITACGIVVILWAASALDSIAADRDAAREALEDEARRADELATIVREAQGREAQAAVNIVALTFALYDATRERAWDTAVIGADVRGRFSRN